MNLNINRSWQCRDQNWGMQCKILKIKSFDHFIPLFSSYHFGCKNVGRRQEFSRGGGLFIHLSGIRVREIVIFTVEIRDGKFGSQSFTLEPAWIGFRG